VNKVYEGFLHRRVLVHIMHQRLHLQQRNASRFKSNKPVVEPLTIDEIREVLRDAKPDYQGFELMIGAVEKGSYIAAVNLGRALDGGETIADGRSHQTRWTRAQYPGPFLR
jgi:hypothetical protein